MSDPVLQRHWEEVTEHWEDEAAHGSFLQYCQETEQLAAAAALYAGQRNEESRRLAAQKKLDAVAFLVISSLLASKSNVAVLPKRLTWIAVTMLGALALYALVRALG